MISNEKRENNIGPQYHTSNPNFI